ncbi:hypothetical protein LOK49_LG04G02151 [Camellia lanceoleosa]|uniref:Uncharacterized protein n=1 Tax=Camellia lanceoleosa TaxID=1840588 RepID=A0ACC0I1N4_9ERIC|nr:hypothetical protein LOK49_LG04G02151 [Camellia lanceoleosa]
MFFLNQSQIFIANRNINYPRLQNQITTDTLAQTHPHQRPKTIHKANLPEATSIRPKPARPDTGALLTEAADPSTPEPNPRKTIHLKHNLIQGKAEQKGLPHCTNCTEATEAEARQSRSQAEQLQRMANKAKQTPLLH